MSGPSDTSVEAERVLTEIQRRLSPAQKWRILGEMYQDARLLHAAGVRLRHPAATPRDILAAWMTHHLGLAAPLPIREPVMEPTAPQLASLRDLRAVLAVFTRLGIAYSLGGSLASSVHGVSRSTQDADVAVEPFPGKEAQLAAALGADYYLSLPAVQEALRERSSFNIINTHTGFKVDVFVRKDDPFEQTAFARRQPVPLSDRPDEPLVLHSPEDIVLFKLRWYRLGGEISDRQWGDVLGVLKVQAGQIDDAYLDQWAGVLGVTDLLGRARRESGS
jgi:hypothetical protein